MVLETKRCVTHQIKACEKHNMGQLKIFAFFDVLALSFSRQISYSQRLVIRIEQSSSRHVISVSGQGNEPKLEFSSTLIEFGPVLPHSSGDEKEVIIRNPSSFPVEIYSLEFDKQYLEEEKVYGSSDFMLFFSRPFPSLLLAMKVILSFSLVQ